MEQAVQATKALSNAHRLNILKLLSQEPMNVNEISEKLNLPFSTTAVNVKKLEDAGLLSTEIIPGRGSRKISSKKYDRIVIDLSPEVSKSGDSVMVEMPIGEYVDCEVEPSCGLLNEHGFLGMLDEPRSFYEPHHKEAQLIWFRHGYVSYRFPNRIPFGAEIEVFEFSAELCSEAPYSRLDWPSDITLWVNDVELATWVSPGDFGGERGFLTPSWWDMNNTQFGMLKRWRVTEEGCFVDGTKMSDITVRQLKLHDKPFISVKIGVKKEAENRGGVNLFGRKFGNYEQDLILKVQYVGSGEESAG
ncbi:MAG TPA: helix-turn-helix domain-containing protein [Bacillales bacterium]|nr:helix-turn-helix domain-containing protein [Bacillales bacterium]